jgi:hypothetical protein
MEKTNEEFIFIFVKYLNDRYNIKLKPTKCRFGTLKLNTAVVLFLRMVIHVWEENSKRDQLPLPEFARQLKSALDL